jgi:hypothetical protein
VLVETPPVLSPLHPTPGVFPLRVSVLHVIHRCGPALIIELDPPLWVDKNRNVRRITGNTDNPACLASFRGMFSNPAVTTTRPPAQQEHVRIPVAPVPTPFTVVAFERPMRGPAPFAPTTGTVRQHERSRGPLIPRPAGGLTPSGCGAFRFDRRTLHAKIASAIMKPTNMPPM